MMTKLVFLLEEPSAKEMLNGLLPRLLPREISYQCVVFEGKTDLEKQIPKKLRGWREPGVCFVILRDQDRGDCRDIKAKLTEICRQAGHEAALVRIACRELESWYMADLKAVEKGLRIENLARKQEKQKYRKPDQVDAPARELERLTQNRYQKVSGSRAIGPHLDIGNRRSNSFRVFVQGIERIVEQGCP